MKGVKFIALRCAGCNNVDVEYLKAKTALSLVHVPAYSPNAVAEHALALLLTLNRKTHKVRCLLFLCFLFLFLWMV